MHAKSERRSSIKCNAISLSDFEIIEILGISLSKMRRIGFGFFGKVQLAKWITNYQTAVAIKSVSKEDATKMEQLEHLKNEKTLLKQLSHPFIVKWYVN
jgi:protein kinase A